MRGNAADRKHSLRKVQVVFQATAPMPDGCLTSTLWEMVKVKVKEPCSLGSGLKTPETPLRPFPGRVQLASSYPGRRPEGLPLEKATTQGKRGHRP